MAYTETTERGFFERLKSSFAGIGLGILLIVGGICLLWWNEGDFVKTREALTEAQHQTVELQNIGALDPSFNGKLVHATGLADTKEILRDPIFDLANRGIALKRKVEYYQWTEHSKSETRQKLGGGEETITTYSYKKQWVHKPIDSQQFASPAARFENQNFVLLALESATQRAKNVSFGSYQLPNFLIRQISNEQPLNVTLNHAIVEKLTRDILRSRPTLSNMQGAFNQNIDRLPSNALPQVVHSQNNMLYLGRSPALPEIGDVRVSFTITNPATISLIAKVQGNSFEPYKAHNGKEISDLQMGVVALEAMFADRQSSNETMTWIFRGLGTLLVIFGFSLILDPLKVLASFIPFLGTIVGAGTGIVSLLLGLAVSIIIIAIAWIRFRPTAAIIMAVLSLTLVIISYVKGKNEHA